MVESSLFDVFLAHNSADKPQVRAIAEELKKRGLNPWLDEEQICAGDVAFEEIQKGISQSKCVVFFIGLDGSGKWQGDLELPITVDLVINSGLRLIPALLPGVNEIPDDSKYLFLKTRVWILIESLEDKNKLNNALNNLEKSIRKAIKLSTSLDEVNRYAKLRDFLAARRWNDANVETARVMLIAVKKEDSPFLLREDIQKFPCSDLKTINQLWLQYTNGHFGFSVQKRIYQKVGLDYKALCEQVGWNNNGVSIEISKLTWDLNTPKGHLPILSVDSEITSLGRILPEGSWARAGASLVRRLEECNID